MISKSRARFERWGKRKGLVVNRVQPMTRDGPRWVYVSPVTETAWSAWVAGRRSVP